MRSPARRAGAGMATFRTGRVYLKLRRLESAANPFPHALSSRRRGPGKAATEPVEVHVPRGVRRDESLTAEGKAASLPHPLRATDEASRGAVPGLLCLPAVRT